MVDIFKTPRARILEQEGEERVICIEVYQRVERWTSNGRLLNAFEANHQVLRLTAGEYDAVVMAVVGKLCNRVLQERSGA